MAIGAVVLCGGESRRMGSPKAWLPIGPETMLQRVVRLVGEVARPVVVVAARGQAIPELPADVIVVRDPVAGRGPVQGLATGLAAIPESVELVYATSTDAPMLAPGWIVRLVDRIGDQDIAVPLAGGELHPLAAVYRRGVVLPVIDQMLEHGRLRLRDVVGFGKVRIVDESELRTVDPELSTLRNLNHPGDYERVLREVLNGDELVTIRPLPWFAGIRDENKEVDHLLQGGSVSDQEEAR